MKLRKPKKPFVDQVRKRMPIPDLSRGDDIVTYEDEVVYIVSQHYKFNRGKCATCLACQGYLWTCSQDHSALYLVGVYDDEEMAKVAGGPGCVIKCVARNGACQSGGLWEWMHGKLKGCVAVAQGLITVDPDGGIHQGTSFPTAFFPKNTKADFEPEGKEAYKKSGFEFL